MDKFWYLVKYSLFKRIKKKAFIAVNVIMLLLVILICNVPNIIGIFGDNEECKILIYDETNKAYDYFDLENNTYIVSKINTFDENNIDKLLENNDCVIYFKYNESNILTSTVYSYDISSSQEELIKKELQDVKLKVFKLDNPSIGDSIDDYFKEDTIIFNDIEDGQFSDEKAVLGSIAMFITLPLFILIVFMMQFLGMDIIEEKSSRSIEYIISNVKASHHFSSKILALILYLLIQGILLIIYALIGSAIMAMISILLHGNVVGINESINSVNMNIDFNLGAFLSRLPMMLLLLFVFALAGILFYIVIEALLSSMATSIEDYQQFQTPIMMILIIGFYIGIFSCYSEKNMFTYILGYIPLFSPILVPMLYITGSFAWYNVLISFAILVIFDILLIKYGLPVYKVSLLDYSNDGVYKKIKQMIKKAKEEK